MKKIVALVLSTLMLLSLAIPAFADDVMLITSAPVASLDPVADVTTVAAGDEFDVQFVISNNPGFMAITVTLVLSDSLTATVTNGSLISDFTPGTQNLWLANNDITDNGVLFTAKVKVDDNAVAGTTFSISTKVECGNSNLDPVEFACGTLTVTIPEGPKTTVTATADTTFVVPGDVVPVSFVVSNNAGFMAIALTVDSTVAVSDVKNGAMIGDFTEGTQLLWLANNNINDNGVLFTANVKVPADAAVGSTITVSVKDITCGNENGLPVDVVAEALVLTVVAPVCNHTETEVKDVVAATCTTDGYTGDVYCKNCGEKVAAGTVVPATGHTTELKNVVAATCTTDGYTGDAVCTVCGETVTAGTVIAAAGHDTEVKNVVAATCDTQGYTGDSVCKVCGTVVAQGTVVDALGHKGGVTSCVNRAVCEICGKQYGELDSTKHGATVVVGAVAPTKTAEGYTGDTCCADCGTVLVAGAVIPVTSPQTGDNMIMWIAVLAMSTVALCGVCFYKKKEN